MDYYRILGVHQDASAEVIKTAYRRLAKIYHPDRNPDQERAERMTQLLNEAYGVLSKPDRRKAYDESLSGGGETRPPRSHADRRSRSGRDRRQATEPFSGPDRRGDERRTGVDRRLGSDRRDQEGGGNYYADRRVREIMEEARRRFATRHSNRFESKDAFFAVILCFFLMIEAPAAYFSNPAHLLLSWPLLAAAVIGAQFARAAAGFYFELAFRSGAESLFLLLFSNTAAAFALGALAGWIQIPLGHEIFFSPMTPSLIAAILPGTVGAGFGRAFSRTLGALAGLLGGAVTGVLTAAACSLFPLLLQILQRGLEGQAATMELSFKPLIAVLAAGALAGMTGSIRLYQVPVFTLLEWLEAYFERFRSPGADSRALIARD